MLIQSSLPGPAEESCSLIYRNGTCDWGTVEENLQKCPNYEKNFRYPYEKLVLLMDCKSKSCSSSSLASSQLSSLRTMDENSGPTFVYHRRKPQKKSVSIFPAQPSARPSDGCLSYTSSEAPSTAVDLGSADGASLLTSAECSKETFNMNSESTNGRSGLEADLCCVNDSYSSSKSNVELGSTSLRTEVDEVGECSSSSALVVEGLQDNMSERDMFICILRNQWFLEGVWPFKIPSFDKRPGAAATNSNSLRTCKVCEIQDTTLEMLICDQCDEAFHVSCCNPRIKKIPIDEWFCYSCLKKKHKILSEMTANIMQHNGSAVSGSEDALSEDKLGPIASMLIDIGPYTPGVRIGQEFQADVPDWSGPSFDSLDIIDEPADVDPLQSVCLHGQDSSMLPRISSIGNWVQCRQVVEGIGDDVDGTICGKWRRAPLFEVQTDNWECFRAVLWDPAHADCAVPQELETDQVLKQLKYIEMLRPRLNAKRRRLDQTNDASGKENNTDDARKS